MNRLTLVLLTAVLCLGVSAQNNSKTEKRDAQNSSASSQKAKTPPAQAVDTEYTDSIIKNTTDKMFMSVNILGPAGGQACGKSSYS